MFKRSLIQVLFWALVCTSVSAQESGVLADPMRPHSRAPSGAVSAPSYRVSGTIVSSSGRVAIFNGKPAREGDRVDGAEILSIGAKAVRIRTGSREFTIYVSFDGASDQSSDSSIQISREAAASSVQIAREPTDRAVRVSSEPASMQAFPKVNRTTTPEPPEPATTPAPDSPARHGPVKRGETLSGIAQQYLSDGITRNQMTMALFQANPLAFSDNINALHEGAVLRIPNGEELRDQFPEKATAEVVRQTRVWLAGSRQHARLPPVPTGESNADPQEPQRDSKDELVDIKDRPEAVPLFTRVRRRGEP